MLGHPRRPVAAAVEPVEVDRVARGGEERAQLRQQLQRKGRQQPPRLFVVGEERLVPRREARHDAGRRLVAFQRSDEFCQRKERVYRLPEWRVRGRRQRRRVAIVGPLVGAGEGLRRRKVPAGVPHVADGAARQRVHVDHCSHSERPQVAQQRVQVHDTAAHEAVGREPAVEVARAVDWPFEGPPAHRDAQLRDARRAQLLQALRRPRRAEQVGIEVRVPVRVHRGHRVDLSACHPRDVVELLVALDAARAEPQQRHVREEPVLHDEPAAQIRAGGAGAQVHAVTVEEEADDLALGGRGVEWSCERRGVNDGARIGHGILAMGLFIG